MTATGYLSEKYVQSMSEFGRPVRLPRSGGYLLQRPIEGTERFRRDRAVSPFCCTDWSSLPADLAGLEGQVVSVVAGDRPVRSRGPGRPGEWLQPWIGAIQGPLRHRPGSPTRAVGVPAPPPQCAQEHWHG